MLRPVRLRLCIVVLVSAWTVSAAAQEETPRLPDLPGRTSALVGDTTALRLNPAGLTFLRGAEGRVYVAGEEGEGTATSVYGGLGLGALGLGLGLDWLPGDESRTTLAASLGGASLSLGAAARFYSHDGDMVDGETAWDLGGTGRAFPWLSLSFVARDVGLAGRPTRFAAGLGLRFWRDRVELGVDRVWAEGDHVFGADGSVDWALRLRVIRGLSVVGGASHGLDGGWRAQAGLQVDLAGAGAVLALGPPGNVIENGTVGVRLSTARYPALPTRPDLILIDLADMLHEPVLRLLPGPPRDPLVELVRLLDQARRDPEVGGVVVRISVQARIDFAVAEELRRSLHGLRTAGKRSVVYLEAADDAVLYLAAAADRVLAAPGAPFLVNGLTAGATFLGEGLSELGVNPEFVRVGRYKNAPDTFTEGEMSEAQREVIEAILSDTAARYVRAVADGRGLSPEAVEAAFLLGLFDPGQALELGLVDGVLFPDELERDVAGWGRLVRDYQGRSFADRPWGTPPVIAVVPVVGNIVSGETPTGPSLLGKVVGAETVVRAVERAADDPRVSAIVLRIDSPGGEAAASDRMWRAVVRAGERKPVVASLGSVAASGGYYVAAGAQEIVADPSTITGSIGIFAGHVDLSGLFDKLGINVVRIRTSPLADILAFDHPWTEAERARMQAYVEEGYETFVARVAAGRPLTVEEVDALGRGRVWTGAQAEARKLVDGLGTFEDAVERARALAGIRPDLPVDLALYAGTTGPLAAFGGRGSPLSELPPAGRELLEVLPPPLVRLRSGVPMALLPWSIEVR